MSNSLYRKKRHAGEIAGVPCFLNQNDY